MSPEIKRAAEALRAGELVVMPTETVYGLACDALNVDAVAKVFAAKARPPDHPLIVHVASPDGALAVASALTARALLLSTTFWPGPLTLILPKRPETPEIVTAGRTTVAVRVPAHPVALTLCEAFGGPIAAPSANPFTAVSPTRIEHLHSTIRAAARVILDGGPCDVGLESTVIDVTVDPPEILRPGMVSRGEIEAVIGPVRLAEGIGRSPGSHPRHYAPRTRLRLTDKLSATEPGLTFGIPTHPDQIPMPLEPAAYAARLYGALHRLDEAGVAEAGIEAPPTDAAWAAVWDRLSRATTS